jgi:transcriptional regulator with XRE-family HTH domain
LGEAIRQFRKQKGFSQEKLAELADLSPVYISRLEWGKENISLDSLLPIAKALRIRLRDLVEEI